MTLITASVVGVGLSGYSMYKQGKQGDAANKQNQQSIDNQTALSRTLADYASKNYALTQPALKKGIDYYSKLTGGGRADIQSAIAPDVAGVKDTYEGTQKYLEQQGVRGGGRDAAIAEAGRKEAGQIGMMPFQARQAATSKLTDIGQQGMSQTGAFLGGAQQGQATAGSQMLVGQQQAYNQQKDRGQLLSDFGGSIANLAMPYILGRQGKGNVLPARQTTPNFSTGLPTGSPQGM
jgi:hypothetical protein